MFDTSIEIRNMGVTILDRLLKEYAINNAQQKLYMRFQNLQ